VAGFAACVAEVGRYLTSVDVVPQVSAVLPHLVNHLARCLQRRRRHATTPTTQVAAVTDEASALRHDDSRSDYNCHELSRRQQSSDDHNCSFLQASGFSCTCFIVDIQRCND